MQQIYLKRSWLLFKPIKLLGPTALPNVSIFNKICISLAIKTIEIIDYILNCVHFYITFRFAVLPNILNFPRTEDIIFKALLNVNQALFCFFFLFFLALNNYVFHLFESFGMPL